MLSRAKERDAVRFRIESGLYDSVTPRREREWRVALTEVNYEVDGTPPTLLVSKRKDGGIDLQIGNESPEGLVAFPMEMLRPHFRSYRRIIEQLVRSTATGVRQMETLDYAKKLVHDEAGEMVQETLEGRLSITHLVARRLFTLFFLVSNELPESLVTRHRHR